MFKVDDEVSTTLYEYDVKGVIESKQQLRVKGYQVWHYQVRLVPKFRMLATVLRTADELQLINPKKQLVPIIDIDDSEDFTFTLGKEDAIRHLIDDYDKNPFLGVW